MKTTTQVPAVDKALDILEYLAAVGQTRTILELSQSLKIPQASAFRLVNTLIERGYLRKQPNSGTLTLGPRSGLLAQRALDAGGLRQAAQPFARELLEATGKTVEVTVFENDEITFVDILESPEPIRYTRTPGTPLIGSTNPVTLAVLSHSNDDTRRRVLARMAAVRQSYLPLHPQLSGFFFSEKWDAKRLETIRKQGYAADYGEQTRAVTRIAAPLLNSDGRVVGTLGIAGPHFDMNRETSDRCIREVIKAAGRFHSEHSAGRAYPDNPGT